MAIKDLIGPGVGFAPGSVAFIVTRGLSVGVAADIVNYAIQAAQFYTAGSVQGMVVPNVVTGQEFTAGALEGDVK